MWAAIFIELKNNNLTDNIFLFSTTDPNDRVIMEMYYDDRNNMEPVFVGNKLNYNTK